MGANLNEKHIKLWKPATYRIKVEGHLVEECSDRLAGMHITSRKRSDQTAVTTLVGRLRDQAELSGGAQQPLRAAPVDFESGSGERRIAVL